MWQSPRKSEKSTCSLFHQIGWNHWPIGDFIFLLLITVWTNKGDTMDTASDPCNQIVPGLWIGSLNSLRTINQDIPGTKQWVVITILSNEKLIAISKILIASSPALIGCRHEVWKISDSCQEDFLSKRLDSLLNLIDESMPSTSFSASKTDASSAPNKACLVHCAQGVSRSAAVCAAWLISRRKLSLQDALAKIRSCRKRISPNLGFVASLRALEQSDGDVRKAMERLTRKEDEAKSKPTV